LDKILEDMFTDFWDVLPCLLEGRYPHFRGTAFSILTVGKEGTDTWYRRQELGLQASQYLVSKVAD